MGSLRVLVERRSGLEVGGGVADGGSEFLLVAEGVMQPGGVVARGEGDGLIG